MNKKNYNVASKEWLELKKLSVKYSTLVKYEMIINTHIDPFFKDYTVYEINDELAVHFFSSLFNQNIYANSTLMTIRYVFKSIDQYIQKKYETKGCNMDLIKISKKDLGIVTLTNNQKTNLSNRCFSSYESINAAVLIALYGGLRLGEICGLRWKDIQFEEGYISINQTVERLKSKDPAVHKTSLMILNPKTATSKRIVPIPMFLLEYLNNYKQHVLVVNVEDFILTNSEHIPDPRTTQYRFSKLCGLFGFSIKFHALRHSYATNCVMQEIDTKSLSEMLGHSTVNTTLNLYVHSSLDFKKKQICKISRL